MLVWRKELLLLQGDLGFFLFIKITHWLTARSFYFFFLLQTIFQNFTRHCVSRLWCKSAICLHIVGKSIDFNSLSLVKYFQLVHSLRDALLLVFSVIYCNAAAHRSKHIVALKCGKGRITEGTMPALSPHVWKSISFGSLPCVPHSLILLPSVLIKRQKSVWDTEPQPSRWKVLASFFALEKTLLLSCCLNVWKMFSNSRTACILIGSHFPHLPSRSVIFEQICGEQRDSCVLFQSNIWRSLPILVGSQSPTVKWLHQRAAQFLCDWECWWCYSVSCCF